jgi:hypothetical protein
MGIYSFCFLGVSPFGSLVTGAVSKQIGVSHTLAGATTICFVVAFVILMKIRKIPTGAVH